MWQNGCDDILHLKIGIWKIRIKTVNNNKLEAVKLQFELYLTFLSGG